MAHKFINVKQIKDYCKTHNKRVGKGFLNAVSKHLEGKLEFACKVHDGGSKTLNVDIAMHSGFKPIS